MTFTTFALVMSSGVLIYSGAALYAFASQFKLESRW